MASAYLPYSDPLIWAIVPGADAGAGSVYEDDVSCGAVLASLHRKNMIPLDWNITNSKDGASYRTCFLLINATKQYERGARAQECAFIIVLRYVVSSML